ncbi:uncharacterized protein CLUP02_00032 [Colletotrichum lupini]|uniref:Uncharacterized protein n=1 Tax=Colletotrichum lupini TaxID=145971 RepID=A0A9Q8W651_9PEZI|nr:uncharacterized protein CLUP02_00032 [Colletotrichum lupini]UQC73388.1 hypothetical protein CLUP02_00032 [Colletotrichum lupini]
MPPAHTTLAGTKTSQYYGGRTSKSGLDTCTHGPILSRQRDSPVKPARMPPPPFLPFEPLIQIAVKHTFSALEEEYIIKHREPGMSFFRKSWGRGDKSEPKAEPEKSSTQVTQATTKPGPGSEFPFEERMRARYHDSAKLKTSLDSIYGQGNYKVKVYCCYYKTRSFTAGLIYPLVNPQVELNELTYSGLEGELAVIEQRIRVHYSD